MSYLKWMPGVLTVLLGTWPAYGQISRLPEEDSWVQMKLIQKRC